MLPWVIRVEPCANGYLVVFANSLTSQLVQWTAATPVDACARVGEILGIPQPSPVPDAFWRAWEPSATTDASGGREKWLARWREIGGQP